MTCAQRCRDFSENWAPPRRAGALGRRAAGGQRRAQERSGEWRRSARSWYDAGGARPSGCDQPRTSGQLVELDACASKSARPVTTGTLQALEQAIERHTKELAELRPRCRNSHAVEAETCQYEDGGAITRTCPTGLRSPASPPSLPHAR